MYKGSNERVSTLVREAVDDFRVVNNQKETKNQLDTFINLVGFQPDDKVSKYLSRSFISLIGLQPDDKVRKYLS